MTQANYSFDPSDIDPVLMGLDSEVLNSEGAQQYWEKYGEQLPDEESRAEANQRRFVSLSEQLSHVSVDSLEQPQRAVELAQVAQRWYRMAGAHNSFSGAEDLLETSAGVLLAVSDEHGKVLEKNGESPLAMRLDAGAMLLLAYKQAQEAGDPRAVLLSEQSRGVFRQIINDIEKHVTHENRDIMFDAKLFLFDADFFALETQIRDNPGDRDVNMKVERAYAGLQQRAIAEALNFAKLPEPHGLSNGKLNEWYNLIAFRRIAFAEETIGQTTVRKSYPHEDEEWAGGATRDNKDALSDNYDLVFEELTATGSVQHKYQLKAYSREENRNQREYRRPIILLNSELSRQEITANLQSISREYGNFYDMNVSYSEHDRRIVDEVTRDTTGALAKVG